MSLLPSGVTTQDVLAIMVVGASLIFNGISLVTAKPLDAASLTLAAAVVGYYFKQGNLAEEPLAPPDLGNADELGPPVA
jgi:hypothetical protein